MKSESFVSVVLVLDRPLADQAEALRRIQGELDAHYTDYEIVAIGQGTARAFGPPDEAVLRNVPGVRLVQLAARVPADVAWAAGLENAIGDFVVLFDPAADPVAAISETVALCKSGFDVVVGVSEQARTWAYRACRSLAAGLLKLVDYALPRGATELRCLSRRAVNSVTSTGRFRYQLSMRIQKTGYPQTSYPYARLTAGQAITPRTLLSGVGELLHLMVFNSSRPLRWMSGLGLIGSVSAFVFAMYSLLVHLVKGNVVEGWTTTILFMSALFMMQFVVLSFFGEYLGRLLDERSERADYAVVFEKNSAVMVNQDRLNVFTDSVGAEANRVQTGRDR